MSILAPRQAGASTTAPATAPAALPPLWQKLLEEYADLPRVPVSSIQQAIQLRVEEGRILLTTTLPLDQRAVLVGPGIQGIAHFTPLAGQIAPPAQDRFMLLFHQLDSAGQLSYLTIAALGPQVQISHNGEAGDRQFNIQLIQDAVVDPAESGQLPLRLTVQESRLTNAAPPVQIQAAAQSLPQLVRENRPVVDRHLRPILRLLDQEPAFFAVDDRLAWQALGDAAADETQIQRVRDILQRLNSDDFATRRRAFEDLKALGAPAALILRQRIDRSALPPETRNAVESFLAGQAQADESTLSQLAEDPGFLLDVLYSGDAALRDLAARRLSETLGRPIDLNPQADPATRNAQITRLRQQLGATATTRP